MTYIVEYIEEKSERFRAVEIESDSQEYADVDAMKAGAKILKLKKVYPKKCGHDRNAICIQCATVPLI